ncbi:Pelargonidin 3-O-(6-caffeoylglucoside) 5-O-(6-O-malonylglucoside) 4'''-malonyltransferase [Linum perenne]
MELVKPSSPQIIQTKPPHKLCLFDQLTPLTYTPVILFYTNPHSSNLLHHLKRSLSDTLNVYYPISGRSTSDNLFIHSFNEGVPFVHVQVDCLLSDFLKRHHPDSLNLLLPRQPFQKESLENRVSFPVLEIQLSVFSCGGFSLSWACSHKLIDAFTLKSFLNLFSSVSRGRQISRTEVEFISCFIWKCYMAASRSLPGSPKTSVLVQAVNLRDVTDPPLTGGNSIGNVFWWATAMADSESKTTELGELASQLSEAIELYKSEYVKSSMQGEEGFDAMSSYFEQLEGLLFGGEEKPDILAFTSWTGTGIAGQDFGWGSPVRLAVMGKPGDGFRNMTVLVDSTEEKGSMEAWITLEEKIMAVFEWDPDFLAFASYSSSSSSSDKLIVSSL